MEQAEIAGTARVVAEIAFDMYIPKGFDASLFEAKLMKALDDLGCPANDVVDEFKAEIESMHICTDVDVEVSLNEVGK